MQFSVGDKVVHPRYGPGRIASVERRDLSDGAKSYFVIAIPGKGLTLRVPVLTAGELGMRLAMSLATLGEVLSTLRSRPQRLPDDPRTHQDKMDAEAKSGEALPLAGVVRDLTWHGERARLTKRDTDLLKLGRERLAAEMALVSGDNASDAQELIGSALTAGLASAADAPS